MRRSQTFAPATESLKNASMVNVGFGAEFISNASTPDKSGGTLIRLPSSFPQYVFSLDSLRSMTLVNKAAPLCLSLKKANSMSARAVVNTSDLTLGRLKAGLSNLKPPRRVLLSGPMGLVMISTITSKFSAPETDPWMPSSLPPGSILIISSKFRSRSLSILTLTRLLESLMMLTLVSSAILNVHSSFSSSEDLASQVKLILFHALTVSMYV